MQQINRKYLACILFFLSILFFFRTVNYKAVWDDERAHFTPGTLEAMDKDIGVFWEVQSGMYIPLTYSTWGIVKKVASTTGFKPAPFHLLNVVIHGLNGVLLFYFLLLLFKNNASAFFGSLLFLIHPLQVESVAWISEFRGLYASFFCLISLLFFFNFMEKKHPERLQEIIFSKAFIFSFLFFVCALLAKSTAIVLPFIILIIVWRFYINKTKPVAISLLIWLLPIIAITFLLLKAGAHIHTNFQERIVIAGFTLFFYLQKLFVPYPLVACYGYIPDNVVNNSFSYVALIISIGITYLLIRKRNQFPDLFAAFLILVACILPVLGLIPFEYQKFSTVADRYVYFSFIGVALLIPSILARIQKNSFLKMCGVLAIVIFSILTIKQTATWKDEFTLWNHTLQHVDNSAQTYYNRGVQYSLKGSFNKAIADYNKAFELDPENTDILFNRANAFENLKDFDAALNDYNTALKVNPKDGELYYKRSNIFFIQMNLDKALDDVQRAEQFKYPVDPNYKGMLLSLKFQK